MGEEIPPPSLLVAVEVPHDDGKRTLANAKLHAIGILCVSPEVAVKVTPGILPDESGSLVVALLEYPNGCRTNGIDETDLTMMQRSLAK